MNQTKENEWERLLAKRPAVFFLVRGLLGCTCPAEIFDHYQVRRHVLQSVPIVQLIMGDRLLVWIIDGAKVAEPGQTLPQFLGAGLAERESRGLNRFRLVVVGDFLSWERGWAHLAEGLDPKVHLHVLPDIIKRSDQ